MMQNLTTAIINSSTFKNIGAMEKMFMKMLEPSSELQKGIQEMMKSYNPMMEAISKQIEISQSVIKALDLSIMDSFSREITRTIEQTNRLRDIFTSEIDASFFRISNIPYEYPDTEENVIEGQIISKKAQYIEYNPTKDEFSTQGNKITFPDENALYVHVLRALLTLSDKNGFCSFEKIDQYLEKIGEKRIRSKSDKKKRIHNAIGHLQREKEYKGANFPFQTPEGTNVIENKRGQGFIINNPLL